MNPVRSIRGLLLTAGVIFSIAIFAATLFVVSSIYERSVRDDSVEDATEFAELTFNAMFELMSTGWNRGQLEGFLGAIKKSVDHSLRHIDIYRGSKVSALFGEIAQKAPDDAVRRAFSDGKRLRLDAGTMIRVIYPQTAQDVCLKCHVNAVAGDVLGVIDVQQDVAAAIDSHKTRFTYAFAPIIPVVLIVTFLMVSYIRRRLEGSIDKLATDIRAVNRISDLRALEARQIDLGFSEFNSVASEVRQLTERIRTIAVDKDMLEFEIRLLEKFVLTSEVIKDWRDYVSHLILDIDSVVPAYLMFSVFKIGEEAYYLEIFWRNSPSDNTKRVCESSLQQVLQRTQFFETGCSIRVKHNVADVASDLPELGAADIDVQIKSLLVDAPKIGGIVGIGMQPQFETDPMRLLVVQSILATLLNVVGSVKAIDKYTKDLEYYATRDPLTNLFNQRVFWELIENEVIRSSRHGNKFALLVIDADNFKSINDSYGHGTGDAFLQLLVSGIRAAIRDDDLLSRYGGDEFAAILPETDLAAAEAVAWRIIESVGKVSMSVPDGAQLSGSVSIGMAIYPDHAVAMKDLFLFADNMMYRAKAEGKNRVVIPDAQDVIDVFRTLGEKSMLILNAVEKRSVVPFYQPIINVATGQVEAIEVLSRIRMEDGSYIIADEYVSIAEKMGVMHKLDFIQLEKALEAVEETGYGGFLFINMSPRALVLNDFVQETRRIASQFRIDPTRLVFEITERETIKNMALLERFIVTLRSEGFKLAIDDFGSGFSSFHYVKRFPIDFLKIEGDFIMGMRDSEKDRALVRSIVALSKDLGIRTVAEYVEDRAVLDQVVAQGIDLAQGYYIHRPHMSLAEVMKVNLP
ncbi:MAG: bifunctional diguanylate cyclase/phosphodiesterase [Betaproteobacteria bacterium]|nr:bifunctional diguanylate cyclase/phosphodiesterase [Betaproteobacteria bacterium]